MCNSTRSISLADLKATGSSSNNEILEHDLSNHKKINVLMNLKQCELLRENHSKQ